MASPLDCCIEETEGDSRAAEVVEDRMRVESVEAAFADGAFRESIFDMYLVLN